MVLLHGACGVSQHQWKNHEFTQLLCNCEIVVSFSQGFQYLKIVDFHHKWIHFRLGPVYFDGAIVRIPCILKVVCVVGAGQYSRLIYVVASDFVYNESGDRLNITQNRVQV